jgi:hypothetical protein
MPEVTISGILRRLELLEAKVAGLIENAGAPIQDTALPPDPDSNGDDRRLPATAKLLDTEWCREIIDRWLARPEPWAEALMPIKLAISWIVWRSQDGRASRKLRPAADYGSGGRLTRSYSK